MLFENFESRSHGPRRIIEEYDPQVSALIEGDSPDKVGILIEHVFELSLKQKVHALLLLSDEEFADFQERRIGGAKFALQQLKAHREDYSAQEYAQLQSELRDANPRYEVEAGIRRRWKGNYPAEWNQDLDIDFRFQPGDGLLQRKEGRKLTYEEAVEFTRFENTRSWYRNVFFPRVTSRSNPLSLEMKTLIDLFRKNRDAHFDPKKPGTDISMKDLLAVIEYYLDYEFDNKENYRVHRIVQQFAGTINDLEESIGE